MADRETPLRAKLAGKMADVLSYRGNALFGEFVALLDAIEACYREEMLTVEPDRLRYKQGAAAQVRLLSMQLTETNPKSITDLPKV